MVVQAGRDIRQDLEISQGTGIVNTDLRLFQIGGPGRIHFQAVGDTIAVTARMNFMNRLVEGYGFVPMGMERARENAARRKKHGYVNMYGDEAKQE